MTVQVTTSPPGTSVTYGYDPASAPEQVPVGAGLLQFQDVRPDGSLGPVWGADDLTVVESGAEGVRVRFPDGTEIVLAGQPQDFAALLAQIAPAAGDGGGGDAPGEAGGSSGAFNAVFIDPLGNVFGLGPDGPALLIAGTEPGTGDDEDPNLFQTSQADADGAGDETALPPGAIDPVIPPDSKGPLFTERSDTVDLRGAISAKSPFFGPIFASDGNVTRALGGDDTVQLANKGEANFLGAAEFFFGGGGNDDVTGGNGVDAVVGDDPGSLVIETSGDFKTGVVLGDDTLRGEFGDDTLSGDSGADIRVTASGATRTILVAGSDTLFGGADDDSLFGDAIGGLFAVSNQDAFGRIVGGSDSLFGGGGNDFIVGDAGGIVSGSNVATGNDFIDGGEDSDTLIGDAAGNIQRNEGNDRIFGGGADDTIYGDSRGNITENLGDDEIYGGGGADTIFGDAGGNMTVNDGDDTIFGDAGNDWIFGDGGGTTDVDTGDDLIIGGLGADTITGGGGSDIFRYSAGDGNAADSTNLNLADVITDFEDGFDKFQLADGLTFGNGAGEASFVAATDVGGDGTDSALVIKDAGGNVTEVLAVIQNVDVSALDSNDVVILAP